MNGFELNDQELSHVTGGNGVIIGPDPRVKKGKKT